MAGKLSRVLEFLTKSRYTRHLEQENAALRAELERWQNALLTAQGLPTITPREVKPLPLSKPRLLPSQYRARMERATHTEKKPDVQ